MTPFIMLRQIPISSKQRRLFATRTLVASNAHVAKPPAHRTNSANSNGPIVDVECRGRLVRRYLSAEERAAGAGQARRAGALVQFGKGCDEQKAEPDGRDEVDAHRGESQSVPPSEVSPWSARPFAAPTNFSTESSPLTAADSFAQVWFVAGALVMGLLYLYNAFSEQAAK